MVETKTIPEAPKLAARYATPDDSDKFLVLARAYADEIGQPFDEAHAKYVFAGFARRDPTILLLEADGEAIGFVLIRCPQALFTAAVTLRQELAYIRADKRSVETEMALHETTLLVFKSTPGATEIEISAAEGPHVVEVVERLREMGLRDAALRMSAVRASAPKDPILDLGSVGAPRPDEASTCATKH